MATLRYRHILHHNRPEVLHFGAELRHLGLELPVDGNVHLVQLLQIVLEPPMKESKVVDQGLVEVLPLVAELRVEVICVVCKR